MIGMPWLISRGVPACRCLYAVYLQPAVLEALWKRAYFWREAEDFSPL